MSNLSVGMAGDRLGEIADTAREMAKDFHSGQVSSVQAYIAVYALRRVIGSLVASMGDATPAAWQVGQALEHYGHPVH